MTESAAPDQILAEASGRIVDVCGLQDRFSGRVSKSVLPPIFDRAVVFLRRAPTSDLLVRKPITNYGALDWS
jgi:hypothetical protein